MKGKSLTPIAVYGSSLFLTAVAPILLQDERFQLIFFAETTAVSTILHHKPSLLLYQEDAPPTDIPILLAAGLVVAEITPHKNQLTIFQHEAPQQCVDVGNTIDFQTKITPLLAPLSQESSL